MATYQNSRYNIALPSGSGGAIVPIKTLTASSSANLSFVDGSSDVVLDNTYRTYIFKFINIHPGTNDKQFTFNLSVDTGSNYNVTKTTTAFEAFHEEDDGSPNLTYNTSRDLAQGTGYQVFNDNFGTIQNDYSLSGEMFLFNPSSTTFVKHFSATTQEYYSSNYSKRYFTGGYFNTTSAIDEIQFKFASGNIDAGDICLYGIN